MTLTLHVGRCQYCGKQTYTSRAKARKASRIHHPGDHLTAYTCPLVPDGFAERWHLGHMPPHAIQRGFGRFASTGKVDRFTTSVQPDIMVVSDERTITAMTRVAQSARITVAGFDRMGVDLDSPLEDQCSLIWRAARRYAESHGFKPAAHRGVPGLQGPMVMKRLVESLFVTADSETIAKVQGLVSQVLRKTDVAVCVHRPEEKGAMPTWFIADRMPENFIVVALGHAKSAATAPTPSRATQPTRAEIRLTPEEAGETKEPGEVSVTQTLAKKRELPPQFKDKADERQALHRLLCQQVLAEVKKSPVPLTINDIAERIDVNKTTVREILAELENEGETVSRAELDSERLVRGGGSLPQGKRAKLWWATPGPVPVRDRLPDGVEPARSASEWANGRVEERQVHMDTVLETLTRVYPKGSNRPRSIGRIAAAAGLTTDQTRKALDRLIAIDLVYTTDSGTYFVSDRRRGSYPNDPRRKPDLEPETENMIVTMTETEPSSSNRVDQLLAELHAEITKAGNTEKLERENAELRTENARLKDAVDGLRKALTSLS